MKGTKSFFERCYTHSLKFPTLELGDARPCLQHTFVVAKKNCIQMQELWKVFKIVDLKVLIEAMRENFLELGPI